MAREPVFRGKDEKSKSVPALTRKTPWARPTRTLRPTWTIRVTTTS